MSAQFSVLSGGILSVLGVLAVAWWYPELARYDSQAVLAGTDELPDEVAGG